MTDLPLVVPAFAVGFVAIAGYYAGGMAGPPTPMSMPRIRINVGSDDESAPQTKPTGGPTGVPRPPVPRPGRHSGIKGVATEPVPRTLVEMSGLVTQPEHLNPSWDMHTPGNVVPVQIQPGEVVRGEVVCHHPFGLGLYLPDHDTYGHVNIPNVADTVVHGPDEFPPIDSKVWARSFGIRGDGRQLNLTMQGVTAPAGKMTADEVSAHG